MISSVSKIVFGLSKIIQKLTFRDLQMLRQRSFFGGTLEVNSKESTLGPAAAAGSSSWGCLSGPCGGTLSPIRLCMHSLLSFILVLTRNSRVNKWLSSASGMNSRMKDANLHTTTENQKLIDSIQILIADLNLETIK